MSAKGDSPSRGGKGILNGTAVGGQRYYYPFDGINRAEMCAIVSRVSGWAAVAPVAQAEEGELHAGGRHLLPVDLPLVGGDVDADGGDGHWAGNYLALAESLGCVAPGEIVDLDGTISRLTIARITL